MSRTPARFAHDGDVIASPWPCQTFIYFAGFSGRAKIGISRNVMHRLASLQTGCPDEIHLYFSMHGDREFESYLHGLFAEYRIGASEWCELGHRLRDWIREDADNPDIAWGHPVFMWLPGDEETPRAQRMRRILEAID